MSKGPGFLFYFTLAMTTLYVLIGSYFIFAESAAEMFPGWRHIAFGLLIFFYAAYRIFRLRKIRKQLEYEKQAKQNEE